jgi:hypothetical protein
MTETKKHGIVRGQTNDGDPDLAIYPCKSFVKSIGYSNEMCD